MNTRLLGGTGIVVGEMGLGCWQLGPGAWGGRDESDCRAIVEAALDAGCNFFDTAPGYAGGHSEENLGRAFKGRRDRAILCTKFGHTTDNRNDFDFGSLRPSLEDSLRRLQTDHVDVLLLHNPPAAMYDGTQTPHYDEMEKLKSEGKVRVYGVSADWSRDIDRVIATTSSQAVEVMFHAFHQETLSTFQRAHEHGIGLIVKVPLDSGWLAGKYTAESTFTDVRSRWTRDDIARRASLVDQLRTLLPPGMTVTEAAFQYVLAQAEVSTVIPGAKSVDQVNQNFAAVSRQMAPELSEKIYALWEREVKGNPVPW